MSFPFSAAVDRVKAHFCVVLTLLETPTSGEVYVRGDLIRMRTKSNGERVPEDQKQVDRIRSKARDGIPAI